jgi:hypothetical protein
MVVAHPAHSIRTPMCMVVAHPAHSIRTPMCMVVAHPAHSIRTPMCMVVKLSSLFREEHTLGLRADFRTILRRGRKVYWYFGWLCKCILEDEHQPRQSREWNKLRLLESRMLRKMFGPNWEDGIGNCIWLSNEKLHNLYLSPTVIDTIK